MAARPLTSHAELLAASGGDPFVRWQVRADVPLQAWQVDGAGRAAPSSSDSGWLPRRPDPVE